MSINIFSILLLIVIVWIIIKNRGLKKKLLNMTLLTVFLELYVEMGYFINIKGTLISYRTIGEMFLLFISILSLVKLHKIKINKNVFFLICIIIIGIINLILIPAKVKTANGNISWDDFIMGQSFEYINFNFFVVQEALQMIVFIINVLAIYNIFEKEDYKEMLIKFSRIIKIILIFGLVEFVIKYILHSNIYNEISNIIFGKAEASVLVLKERGTGYILQGFTTEASHYAYVLMVSTIILFASNQMTNKEKKWIGICIFLMCTSMSFSSILFVFGLSVIYILYRISNTKTNKIKIIKIFLIFLIILIMMGIVIFNFSNIFNNLSENNFLQRRLKSLIQEIELIFNGEWTTSTESLEWSNRVRLVSSFETLRLIKYRPLFGLGIASVTSHGSTTMLLAGIGVLGSYFWTKYIFFSLKNNLCNVNRIYYDLAIVTWFLINMLNSMGLRPFYELSSVFLMEAFIIIFSSNIKIKI